MLQSKAKQLEPPLDFLQEKLIQLKMDLLDESELFQKKRVLACESPD